MIRQRVRFRFQKQGDLRFIGHLDLVRTMERMFRRARLPLGMTEGFHPKPRMSFPLPLPVGMAGRDEVMEVEFSEAITAEEILAALEGVAVPGLSMVSAQWIPTGVRKAQVLRATYCAALPAELHAAAHERIAAVFATRPFLVERGDDGPPVELHEQLDELALVDGLLRFTMRASRQRAARPQEVLAALALGDLAAHGLFLERTTVELV